MGWNDFLDDVTNGVNSFVDALEAATPQLPHFATPQPQAKPSLAPPAINNAALTKPATDFNKTPKGYTHENASVPLENFMNYSYPQALSSIGTADDDVAPGIPQGWTDINTGISAAMNTFKSQIDLGAAGADQWQGATATAAVNNIQSSLSTLTAIGEIALALNVLSQGFSDTITTTKNAIVTHSSEYTAEMAKTSTNAHLQDQVKQKWTNYASNVMQTAYQPNIQNIAADNPSFNTVPTPASPASPATATPSGAASSPSYGGGGGSDPVAGSSTPVATPDVTDPASSSTPNSSATPADSSASSDPSSSSDPSATSDPSGSMDSLAYALPEAAQGLMSPLQSLGQLGRAGQGAGTPGALANGLGKLPEGAIKGLKGGAGAGAGGAGAHGATVGKSAGAPAAAAGSSAGRTVATGARAGLSSTPGAGGMGAPGAGSPAAGHQGGAGQGAAHQPGKMLRRKKNGEDIIGDAQAVVAVLGEPAEATKPDAT